MVRRLASVLALTVMLAACADFGYDRMPDVEVGASPTTATTAAPNFSGVVLPPVGGVTSTTIDASPGRATLSGTVSGPDGAVGGATVRAEWLVGDAVIPRDVKGGPDGRWVMEKVPGGRYRLRAWRVPDLVSSGAEVFLLGIDEQHTVDFQLEQFGGGRKVDVAVAPDPPPVGQAVNLVVRVADRAVDEQGIARAEPVAGAAVELFGEGAWSLSSPNPANTGGDGTARFMLTCRRRGRNPLSVVVAGAEVVELPIADCVPGPDNSPNENE